MSLASAPSMLLLIALIGTADALGLTATTRRHAIGGRSALRAAAARLSATSFDANMETVTLTDEQAPIDRAPRRLEGDDAYESA